MSKGKKGLKKKTVDPFSRKDWYGIKVRNLTRRGNERETILTLPPTGPGSV